MNILYTITSYPPSIGGAQLYIHEIARRAARNHTVNVGAFFDENRNDWLLGTTLRAKDKEIRYIYEGVKVACISFNKAEKIRMFPYVYTYYFNKKNNINALSKFIELKLQIYGNKIDLIHNVRVGREPLSYASYNLAKKLRVPFVFTPLHHPRWGHWFYKEYHELYRKADAIFALTPYEKEVYKKLGVNEKNIFVTGTGPVIADTADPGRFRNKYNISGNIVLFIGQGYKYKGISDLLKAAKIVFRFSKETNFIFIGPHTRYSERLFKKKLDPRIMHLGNLDLQAKTDALAACDIFCLPSRQESFGAVFLEAWYFRKPVIGLNIPQVRCLIKDGSNGFLVEPEPEIIANRIMELIGSPDLRKKMGISGKEMVENNFTWDILYDKTFTVYQNILNKFTK